jgi:hypothetical protein
MAEQRIDTGTVSVTDALANGGLGAVAGAAGGRFGSGMQEFHIPGITTGRNSWIANYNRGVTNMGTGRQWTISPGVSVKGGFAQGLTNAKAQLIENLLQGSVAPLPSPAPPPPKKKGP